ncbi:hypothetical protein AAHC03_022592 [Spirometra sp. Aus1]
MASAKSSAAIAPVKKDPDAGHCPICRDEIDFYSYGACDHPTCSRCAVKIRRFGNVDEPDFSKCPTCRGPLNRIILMTSFKPFAQVDLTSLLHDVELDFLFENDVVEASYKKLITCKCLVCDFVAKTMSALNRHTTSEHNLSYCDLCLRNARLLPCEFVPMEPQALAAHRKWDKDKKRGHPKCEFCDNTFYEFEDLVKHIREAHFLCDFCHANALFEVFRRQHELLQHYKDAHFVCPECDARGRIVCYATFDQLGLHRLHEHPQETANDPRRWDPVQIRFPTQGLYGQHGRVDTRVPAHRFRHGPPEGEPDPALSPERPPAPEEWTGADFPSLDRPNNQPNARQEPPPGTVPATTAQQTSASGPTRSLASIVSRGRVNMMSTEDFPSLPSAPSAAPPANPQAALNWSRNATTTSARASATVAASAAAARRPPAQSEFPALGNAEGVAPAANSNWGRQSTSSSSMGKKEPAAKTSSTAASVVRHQQPVPGKSDFPSLNVAASASSGSSPLPPPLIPPVVAPRSSQKQQQKKKQGSEKAKIPPESTAVVSKATNQPPHARLAKGKWWNYAGDIDSEPIRDEAAELAARNHIQLIPATAVEPEASAPSPRQVPNFSRDEFPTLNADEFAAAHPVAKPPQQQKTDSKKSKKNAPASGAPVANGSATSNAPTKQAPKTTGTTVLKDLEDTEIVIFDKATYAPPPEAEMKNRELIRIAESCLTESQSAIKNSFSRFADLSRLYRYGQLSANAYLQGLDGLLSRLQSNGDSQQLDWLASMVALLPDVGRQRALLRALKGEAAPRVPHAATPQRALATTPPAWCKPVCNKLTVCNSCGQVCLRSELKTHTGAVHH